MPLTIDGTTVSGLDREQLQTLIDRGNPTAPIARVLLDKADGDAFDTGASDTTVASAD